MLPRDKMIKVAQINMNGNQVVPIQILDFSLKKNIDILLLQEMPWSGSNIFGLEAYTDRTIYSSAGGPALASIVVLNDEMEVLAMTGLMNRYFEVTSIRKDGSIPIVFVSVYFKYEFPTLNFTRELENILNMVGENVVIGADINTHSPL